MVRACQFTVVVVVVSRISKETILNSITLIAFPFLQNWVALRFRMALTIIISKLMAMVE